MNFLGRWIRRVLSSVQVSIPNVTPPPPATGHTPTPEEKMWARRELAAMVRRAREAGVYVDLNRIQNER